VVTGESKNIAEKAAEFVNIPKKSLDDYFASNQAREKI